MVTRLSELSTPLHSFITCTELGTKDSLATLFTMDVVSHARDIPYWTLLDMKRSLSACHSLFRKQQPTWDQLYLLQVMTYGDLQKGYKLNDEML